MLGEGVNRSRKTEVEKTHDDERQKIRKRGREEEEEEEEEGKEQEEETEGAPRLTMRPDLWFGRTYIELHTIS